MDHVEYAYMEGLTEEEVARFLDDQETGVLALAREGDAYGIPVSYEHESGTILVRLAIEPESKKLDYLGTTEDASLVVYATEDDVALSVVATGPLRELSAAKDAPFDDATINAEFGPVHVYDQPIDDIDVRIYELEPSALTGRRSTLDENW